MLSSKKGITKPFIFKERCECRAFSIAMGPRYSTPLAAENGVPSTLAELKGVSMAVDSNE